MNWKNMSNSQKIATIISVIPIVVWLIYKVKPDLSRLIPPILLLRYSQLVKLWHIGILNVSGLIF